MDNQKLILFVALSVIILMLWSAWESEQRTTQPAPSVQSVPAAPPPSTAPAPTGQPQPLATALLGSGERIVVSTDVVRAEIDTQGGDIRILDLTRHSVSLDKRDISFRLLDDQGKETHVAQSGLIARDIGVPNHKSRYRAEVREYKLAKGQDRLEVRLHWSGPGGVKVIKTYTFRPNDYRIDLSYEIRNDGRKAHDIYLYAQLLRHEVKPEGGLASMPTYTGGVIYTSDKKYEKIDFDAMRSRKLERDTENGWVAMLQHYFVSAWMPDDKGRHQLYSDTAGPEHFILGYKTLVPVTVAPGERANLGSSLYAGPKEQERLEKQAKGLDLTVDYGWLTFIAAPLFWTLEWLHRMIGNWGWAIIVLTLLIKLVFYPLSVASYRSMAQMKKLNPRIQQLKERHKDDKQKLQQAMMELYKTEKINPLGGCLPILIQIPVFIALYWVLLESVELRQAPWALWIKDLAAPDPFFVLPILMGASMLAQQWLNPQPLEDLQKKVMYALPVVFTFMFLWFPSGLVLYWVVQNLLSIAQQWQINRAVVAKK
jgi:YidC/Oxa1 family membrane protein insertase